MLRAFTRGYGIFHIPCVPIFHLYTELTDIKRALHWDPEEDTNRSIKWHEVLADVSTPRPDQKSRVLDITLNESFPRTGLAQHLFGE